MAEYKNIVGTGFPPQIQEQIKKREAIVNSQTRDHNTLQFLTNRNAWVRLSSGVQIPNQQEVEDQGINDLFTRAEINEYYRNKRNASKGSDALAKNNVLQGGTISVNGNNTTTKKGFNQTYTQGATDNLGFKPMPGITNVSITTGGKWQTLLQADIEFICYDLDQLETMSKLYMSLGCTVFLEWGHTNYFKNDNTFETNPQTLSFFSETSKESLRKKATNQVINTQGNYESITGTVYNFSYSSNSDGSYNCKTQIMGAGGLVESLKINNSTNYTFDVYSAKEEESNKFSSTLENALYTLQKFISSYGEPDTVATDTQSNSNGKETRLFLKVPFNTPILKNQKTKEKDTYSNLLTRIFQLPNYKGPSFTPQPFSSNENVIYGNPWSLLSGYREGGADLVIPQDFYAGYKTIATTQTDPHKPSTYITLGHLMALVQHLGIFTENSGNKTTPVVYIDYNPENTIIKRGIIEASVDPGKCLVPYSSTPTNQSLFFDPFLTLTPDKEVLLWWTTKRSKSHNLLDNPNLSALDKIENLKNSFEGKLFNVLINIDFAIDSLKNLSNNSEDKNVNLIEYIDTILNGVNISLGKVNALRTFYDDRSNCIRIIDENYQKSEVKDPQILKLENFGTKSTVYDYSFSSKITPKLASQIVISAQALDSGGIQEFSEDVLSYQKLNGDIVDKFAVDKKPPLPPQLSSNQQDGENKISLQKLFYHLYNVYTLADLKSSTIDNLTTLYADLQNQTYNLIDGTPTLLIPLEYQLTMDGISGILPYTIFRIPDSRLPKRYKGKVDFVVFSINHSIENNKWYTTLRGQTLIRN